MKVAGKRGNPRLDQVRNKDTTAAKAARVRKADEFAMAMKDFLAVARYEDGAKTYGDIARWLNAKGVKTPRGNAWSTKQVERLVERLAALGKVAHPARPPRRQLRKNGAGMVPATGIKDTSTK